ncbi:50S ribosomal protein L19e [Candidatus Woesearchaeota archaeon]|nr:50S ribosomal protein L19e [Candidatus Woesearchaeota archaeon]
MDLKLQKKLAADVLKCSPKRIRFDKNRLDEISEALTRTDIRMLASDKAITRKNQLKVSPHRRKHQLKQKRKGRGKGSGSRKGTPSSRKTSKQKWVDAVRIQRKFLKELRSKGLIKDEIYRNIICKIKGGFFRSRRHIKVYLNEHDMFIAKAKQTKKSRKSKK